MRTWQEFLEQSNALPGYFQERPIIAPYGCYQIGKSTLINCLADNYVALAGHGKATTALTIRYRFGEIERIRYRSKKNGFLLDTTISEIRTDDFLEQIKWDAGFHIEAQFPSPLLKKFDIVDTPGYNMQKRDTDVALNALDHLHYVLFVTSNRGFDQKEKELLQILAKRNIAISVLMNCNEGRCQEKWIPTHRINEEISMEKEFWLDSMGIPVLPIGKRKVYPCNFLFYWSQVDAFSLCEQDIDRYDTVQKHIKNLLQDEGYLCDRETIRQLSGISTIKDSLWIYCNEYNSFSHTFSTKGLMSDEPLL